jgi:hypothetical protein
MISMLDVKRLELPEQWNEVAHTKRFVSVGDKFYLISALTFDERVDEFIKTVADLLGVDLGDLSDETVVFESDENANVDVDEDGEPTAFAVINGVADFEAGVQALVDTLNGK